MDPHALAVLIAERMAATGMLKVYVIDAERLIEHMLRAEQTTRTVADSEHRRRPNCF